MNLALTLPLRDPKGLDDTLNALYDPNSPIHGQFLTPQQFADRFAPTQAQYDAVAAYAQSKGFTVTGTHNNRLVLDVQGSVATVEQSFGVHLNRYLSPEGREFFGPDTDPSVDMSMTGLLFGVIGLDNAAVPKPELAFSTPAASPTGSVATTGSGVYGGLSPSDIKTAYNLNGLANYGAGQSVALFEADGFNQSDITAYETKYALPNVPLQTTLLDGASGNPIDYVPTDAEPALDIEMVAALAPNVNKIYVYEVPNYITDYIDAYSKIASDDNAKVVSTSWVAGTESALSIAFVRSENAVFEQMAAQGQSMYASSGDNGAYANGQTLSLYDPSSQPFVCSVGGTTLSTNGPGGSWASEATWQGSQPTNNSGGSGGGVSVLWPIPSWQAQPISATQASTSSQNNNAFNYRNVPDVALNADPTNSPYSIYVDRNWITVGGTSAAAPLWAAFTALVNQQRAADNSYPSDIGLVNPYLYNIGTAQYLYTIDQSSQPVNDFHDITQGNNLYDFARIGYDDATGWGSFNGTSLLNDLADETGAGLLPLLPQTFMLPFYRFSQPTYGACFSDAVDEAAGLMDQGWTYNGVCGLVYSSGYDSSNLVPLLKMSKTQPYVDNLFTTSYAEYDNDTEYGGYTGDWVYCQVFPDGSQAGTIPVYRAYNANGQHFMTTNATEYQSWLQNGYSGEGIKFYILAP